jgi:hypothetical protein
MRNAPRACITMSADPMSPTARSETASWLDRRLVAYLFLIVAFLLPALAFWPGVITPDSNQTIYQAASKFSSDWWTAFGSIALREWDALELGLGGVYGIALALNVFGVYLCLRAALRRVPAALVTIGVIGWPAMYAQLSGLSRDTFFLGFALLAFGAMAAVPRVPEHRRRLVIGGALLAAVLCFLCRQNGIVVVFAVAAWAGFTNRAWSPRAMLRASAIAAAVCVLVLLGTLGLYRALDVRAVHAERFTYVYDLASISVLTGENQFPPSLQTRARSGWVTSQVDQRTLKARWSYPNVISLYPDNRAGTIAFADETIAKREAGILKRGWLEAVTSHPFDYLWGRVRLAASQLGLVRHPTDAFLPFVDPSNFGHPMTFSRGYDAAASVLGRWVGQDPWVGLDYTWMYLFAAIVLTVALWRRSRSAFAVATTTALALNVIVMGFVAVASSFRYSNLAVPVALILLAHWVAGANWAGARLRSRITALREGRHAHALGVARVRAPR